MAKGDEMSAFERAMLDETRAHNARMAEIAASQARAGAPPPRTDVAGMTDEAFAANVRDRKGLDRPPIPEDRIEGCAGLNGSTFTARIVRGRVVDLVDYAHPEGVEVYADEGGLVPTGHPIKDEKGNLFPLYQQWKWENFWQADINAFVGKPLPEHVKAAALARVTRAAE